MVLGNAEVPFFVTGSRLDGTNGLAFALYDENILKCGAGRLLRFVRIHLNAALKKMEVTTIKITRLFIFISPEMCKRRLIFQKKSRRRKICFLYHLS